MVGSEHTLRSPLHFWSYKTIKEGKFKTRLNISSNSQDVARRPFLRAPVGGIAYFGRRPVFNIPYWIASYVYLLLIKVLHMYCCSLKCFMWILLLVKLCFIYMFCCSIVRIYWRGPGMTKWTLYVFTTLRRCQIFLPLPPGSLQLKL